MKCLITQLTEKGILFPDGTLDTDALNLISGTHTPDFAETLWTFTAGDSDTTTHIYEYTARLYAENRLAELYEFIAILYGVLGLKVPAPIAMLTAHPEALNRYLYEFLLDYDDVIGDIAASDD